MRLRDRVNEAVARSQELKRETSDALMTSLRAEIAIIRTLCTLARAENGIARSHHLEQAKIALDTIVKLSKQVIIGKRERDEIEEVQQDILSLGTTPESV